MIDLRMLRQLFGGLDPQDVDRWVAQRWVIPETDEHGWVFHEVDIARVRLIVELRRDLEIDEAAMPVVLGLLDRLYAARRQMKALAEVIENLPPDIRAAVKFRLNTPD